MAESNNTNDDAGQFGSTRSSTASRKLNESIDSLSVSLSRNIEVLASELRARWKSGHRVVAESLADGRHAETWRGVVGNDEHLLDLLYHEILIRQEFGEPAECSSFVARFPHLRERIERLFAVHSAIEDDDWDDLASEAGIDDEQSAAHSSANESGLSQNSVRSSSIEQTPSGATPQWPRRSRSRFIVEPPPGYELLDELGRGGMAVVYRARQQILNRIVALKMLLGGGLASSEVLARLRQEARAVAQLQHPGIVQIYEVGEHNGLPYLSLEFVAGGTLHDWLKGQPLPPMEACRIIEQLALITQFAHERGIVHRDLKPANILLTERPDSTQSLRTELNEPSRASVSATMSFTVKIGDFGLARILGHQSDLTATGQVIGTPSYMSPEQAAGTSDDASPAQDVYSLGAILFELLTGRPPFRGATLFDTLEQVRTDEPVPPRRLQPRVSIDLETVCLKCLQKAPERRYRSAQELANDLRAIQNGEPIHARPASATERFLKLVRRHPTVSGLTALTLIASIAGVAGVLREGARATRERDRALNLSIAVGRERDEAREQRKLADQQRILAESARSEAVIARQEAEQSLDQALSAMNSLSRFGIELRQTPQQQQTSRRILEETLKLYDQLEQSHGNNTRLRRQLAFTLARAGEIQSVLRETTKANLALRRSIELLQAELQVNPDDRELWWFLSFSSWVLGNLLKDTRQFPEAVAFYNMSLDANNQQLRLAPGDVNLLRGKANVLTNICAATTGQRKQSEAIPIYEEAISILRSLVAMNSEDVASQSELGLVLHDYSETLASIGRADDAKRMFDESFAIREALFRKDPNDHGTRNLFARLYMSRGSQLMRAKQPLKARTAFEAAAQMLEPTIAAFPTIFEFQNSMINSLVAQVNASLAAKDAEGTEKSWSLLIDRLVQCRTVFPLERQVVFALQNWAPDRCEHLFEQGRTADSQKLHQELIRASEWLISDEAAAIEPKATDSQRSTWRNNLAWYLVTAPEQSAVNAKRAIEVVQQALQVNPQDANHLHTLATAYYYAGQLDDAAKTLETAISHLPASQPVEQRDPMFAVVLAMTHAKLGHPEVAAQQIATLPEVSGDLSKTGPHLRRMFSEARKVVQDQQAGSVK